MKRTQIVWIIVGVALASTLLHMDDALAGKDRWDPIGPDISNAEVIRAIAVDPLDSLQIWAGNDTSTVFYTSNGGTSWTNKVIAAATQHLVVDVLLYPNRSDTVFAATDSAGVYRTYDNGVTPWTAVNSGLRNLNVKKLDIHRQIPRILYAAIDSGVFRSDTLGSSWYPIHNGLDTNAVTTLAVDPTFSNTVYVGTSNGRIYRTDNGGNLWQLMNTITGGPSVSTIVVNPKNPNIVYVGTQNNGVYRSPDKGVTFSAMSSGLVNVQILSMAIDTTRVPKLYVGTNGNGAHQKLQNATTWQAINTGLTNGRIQALTINPSKPFQLFAGTQAQGVFKYDANQSPEMTQIVDQQVSAGDTLILTVEAVDADSGETEDLEFGSSGLPSNATFDPFYYVVPNQRIFTWIPSASQAGLDTLIFTVQDQRGGTDADTIIVYVNRRPVLAAIGTKAVNENEALSFTISATDADGDSLSYTTSTVFPSGATASLPPGATFNQSTRTFSWTPSYDIATNENVTRTYSVTFTATDSIGATDAETVKIVVTDKNRPPTFVNLDSTISVFEGQAVELEIQGQDLDLDPLLYGIADSLPTGAHFDSVSTRLFTWIPGYAQADTHTVIFTLNDQRGGTAADTLSVIVLDVNRLPVLGPLADTVYVLENDSVAFEVTASDADNDTLVYNAAGLPAGATFDKVNTQRFFWLPNYTQSGIYTITFNVEDTKGGSDFASVVIVVNDPPFFNAVSEQTVNENSPLSYTVSAVDPDGDALTYTTIDVPTGATVTITTSILFSWTPTYFDAGTHYAEFAVDDGKTGRDTIAVKMNVVNVNQPPQFVSPGAQSVNIGNTLQFAVRATESDNESVTYAALTLPSGASFDAGTQIFSWTPATDQIGNHVADFTATDASSESDTMTVNITVTNQNYPPVITTIADKSVGEGDQLIFAVVASDINQDVLSYAITGTLPTGAQFNTAADPSPLFIWTPDYDQNGEYSIIFIVNDGNGGSASDTVNITVTNVNRMPELSLPVDTTVVEGDTLRLNLQVNDPDGDSVTVTVLPAVTGAEIQTTIDGIQYIWPVSYIQAGEYNLTFIAQDTLTGADTSAIVITITDFNRLPTPIQAIYPSAGQEFGPANYFVWQKSYDLDEDNVVKYHIQIDDGVSFASPEIDQDEITISSPLQKSANGIETVSLRLNQLVGFSQLSDNTQYYWRVRAYDNAGGSTSFTSTTSSFTINKANSAPEQITSGFIPESGESISTLQPTIRWNPGQDPDPGDAANLLSYIVELDKNEFQSGYVYRFNSLQGVNHVTVTEELEDNQHWYFRVKAVDDDGAESPYSGIQEFYTNVANDPPAHFSLISPANSAHYDPVPESIQFEWQETQDPDPMDNFSYILEISTDAAFSQENIIVRHDDLSASTSSVTLDVSELPAGEYFWRVTAIDGAEDIRNSRQIHSLALGMITDIVIPESISGIPDNFVLGQNYPNPFNAQTVVFIGLPQKSAVHVVIYNALGQEVTTLFTGIKNAGYYRLQWNGLDTRGYPVPTGIYFVKLITPQYSSTIKMVYLK